MCSGIKTRPPEEKIIYFPNPNAVIEISKRNGEKISAVWGRRGISECPDSGLPVTGWARYDSIRLGLWDRLNPEKVYIEASAFMEKDSEKKSHWFDIGDDRVILGLLVRESGKDFVYIVTSAPPEEYSHIHNRWPVIVKKNK